MEQNRFNVNDFYKFMDAEQIKANLDTKRFPYSILLCNLTNDFNKSSAIRSSNVFMAKNVYMYGKKKYDRRGCMGTEHVQNLIQIPEGDDFSRLKDYTWVAMELTEDSVPLDTFEWPSNPLILFGEEQRGLSQEMLDRCKHKVYIRQYGSTRSLNVSVCSGIAMNDFVTKYQRIQKFTEANKDALQV